jgi:hypothetical protein
MSTQDGMYVFSPGFESARNGPTRPAVLIQALEFLEIPKQKWTSMVESTVCASVDVCASVEGLAFMHRIWFSTSTQHSIFDTGHPMASGARKERLQVASVKPQEMHKIVNQCILNRND